jgi:undecaprenyl-diphosphatase
MKKSKEMIILFVIISMVASLYWDNLLIKGISLLRNGVLDSFFLGITFVSSEIIMFFVLTSFFLWKKEKRKWIIPLWSCLGISALVSFILKIMIQRARPFQLGIVELISALESTSYSIWNFSFPSFQSMLVFCSIPILSKQFPKLKKFWIAFAILVAFSRVYFGVHFVSDVIAGGVIGYLIGVIVVREEKENRFGEKIYNRIFKK